MSVTIATILTVAMCGIVLIAVDGVDGSNRKAADAIASETGLAGPGSQQDASSSGLVAIVKMTAALAIVLVAIYAAMYGLNRVMKKRRVAGGRGGALDVIESVYVGPKKTISLVRVGDRSVLVGVTDNSVSMLTELGDEETSKLLAAQEAPAPEAFGTVLSSAMSKVKQFRFGSGRTVVETH
jgi:flagellar protein FliO/FliZ